MTHGWGQRRSTDENGASLEAVGSIGVGPLRKAGFNVLTWDSRGFGQSGGTVTVDYQDNEGRDVVCAPRLARRASRRRGSTRPATRASACTAPPTPAASSG